MARTKKETSATVELTAADRRDFAEFLSTSHASLRLWRKCTKPACRRARRCGGEVDECGAACAPKEWTRVRRTVIGMRDGHSQSEAERTARTLEEPQIMIIDYGELGEFTFEVDAEGKWTLIKDTSGPGPGEMTHEEWERSAPPG
jgi:hypothetical protein